MCTALSVSVKNHYFGRNLDLEYGYREQVAITPRNYPFLFRHLPIMDRHYAMIGMATVVDGYPLYYEATNEKGLSIAGLNFPRLAHYSKPIDGKTNVAVFEFIPWLLCQFKTVTDVKAALHSLNLVDTAFSSDFTPTPLHWMVADKNACIVLEPTEDGLRCYDNPVCVMTNAPEFSYHLTHLTDFQHLSPLPPENRFSPQQSLSPYSGAMGAIGLPGDWSSASRFVRAAFLRSNWPKLQSDDENINHFFRVLQAVAMPMGGVQIRPGLHDITRYSCCCNADTGRYYYTTYANQTIRCIEMGREDLGSTAVITYDLQDKPLFLYQNRP